MERSLVIVKPDAVARNLGGTIISRLEALGLRLVALKMLHMTQDLAHRQYAVHEGKSFFNELVRYMTSAPVIAAVFEGEKAVEAIRKAAGLTDPAKAGKGTIRGDYGLSVTQNSVHASDSTETAEKEIKIFFSEKEIVDRE